MRSRKRVAVVSALALAASSCFSYTAETKELHVVNVVQRLDAKNNPQDLRPKNQQSVENQQLGRTLLQVLQLTQSIQVDEISFSSSTSSLANSKLWMRALGLLCTMACGALRPHNAMYNSLTGSLENSGQWPFASSLLEEMICTRVLETCRSAHFFYHFVSFCYFNLRGSLPF